MELSFQLADPAGNITLLVTTPVPREDHPTLAAGLLSIPELHAEQVGFLVPPQGAGVIRLAMMGGEQYLPSKRPLSHRPRGRAGPRQNGWGTRN